MTDQHRPTQRQQAAARIAHDETLELFKRLEAEGLDWREAIAGVTSALTTVIDTQAGPGSAARHFTTSAIIARG